MTDRGYNCTPLECLVYHRPVRLYATVYGGYKAAADTMRKLERINTRIREAAFKKKTRQQWLIKHVRDRRVVSKTMFKTLLPHIASIEGEARERFLRSCKEI